MSAEQHENIQPDLPELGDEAAEVEVVAHSDEQAEDALLCPLFQEH